MEEEIQKNIEERMAELPEDVRAAILASDFEEKIRTISQKNNLHIDQAALLGDLAMLVMLGFASGEAFEANLATSLRIPAAQATTIATDINTQLFMSIRESMKNFANTKEPPTPLVPKAQEIHPADAILLQKTVTIAPPTALKPTIPPATPKVEPTAPQPYKADPYREPTT